MLYTKKGDNGKSKLFGCNEGLNKDSEVFNVLGTFDELNSFLGICKIKAGKSKLNKGPLIADILEDVQQSLFIIQANLAGATKDFNNGKTILMEEIIDKIEKSLSPIKSFCVSGGSELSAYLDYSRTIARKTERKFVGISQKKKIFGSENIFPFLNRLSSLLYALSRFANLKAGVKEANPKY